MSQYPRLPCFREVKFVRHGNVRMRRGEPRFERFITSIVNWQHVRGATYNITLSNGTKIRVSFQYDDTVLELLRVVTK